MGSVRYFDPTETTFGSRSRTRLGALVEQHGHRPTCRDRDHFLPRTNRSWRSVPSQEAAAFVYATLGIYHSSDGRDRLRYYLQAPRNTTLVTYELPRGAQLCTWPAGSQPLTNQGDTRMPALQSAAPVSAATTATSTGGSPVRQLIGQQPANYRATSPSNGQLLAPSSGSRYVCLEVTRLHFNEFRVRCPMCDVYTTLDYIITTSINRGHRRTCSGAHRLVDGTQRRWQDLSSAEASNYVRAALRMYTLRAAGRNHRHPITWVYVPLELISSTNGTAMTVTSVLPPGAQLCKWPPEESGPVRIAGNHQGVTTSQQTTAVSRFSAGPQRSSRSRSSSSASVDDTRRAYEAPSPPPGYGHASVVQGQEVESLRRERNRTPIGLREQLTAELNRISAAANQMQSRARSRSR